MGDGSLESLQRLLADALRAVGPVGSRPVPTSDLSALLAPGNGRLEPAGRLEVYREQYWLRHLSNLGDDFPTLAWAVGAAAFREIGVAYLQSHPPRTWNLQRLGVDLPGFLSRGTSWSTDTLALDSAHLDWAFMEVFDAADAGPLDLETLAGAPEEAWAAARIEIHPAVRRLVLSHPVHDVRAALKSGDPVVRPAPATTHLVVWRDARCILRAVTVEPMAFDLLGELTNGAPLGQACESAARAQASAGIEDLDAKVGGWFQQWTASGWVSGVHLSGSAV
jgi:hypothetical protein